MKKYSVLGFCALLLVVIFLFSGCSEIGEAMENGDLRHRTEAMLNAIIAHDQQMAYSYVESTCTQEQFYEVFPQMEDALAGVDNYELKLLSAYTNTGISDGEKRTQVSGEYELISENSRLIVNAVMDSQKGLVGFHLTPYERTDRYYTGTLGTMKEATTSQWVFLLLNLIPVGVILYAIVDCCKQKIGKKILWILVLVLGLASFGATVSDAGFRVNFNLLNPSFYSALIYYGSGTTVIRLMVPVSAIVYFFKRSSLIVKDEPLILPKENLQDSDEG